jgi:hypothetical protein
LKTYWSLKNGLIGNKVSARELVGSNEDRKEILVIDVSPIYCMLFLLYVFTQTAWEMAITTSHQRSILKIQKPVEVLM